MPFVVTRALCSVGRGLGTRTDQAWWFCAAQSVGMQSQPTRTFTTGKQPQFAPVPFKYLGEKMNVKNTKAGFFGRIRMKKEKEARAAQAIVDGKPRKKQELTKEAEAEVVSLPAMRVQHPSGETERFRGDTPTIGDEVDPSRDIFAIVSISTVQHKVMKGDIIMVDKILGADLNTQLTFDRVLMLGTRSWTLLGRPFISNCYVKATVEEQTKLAKVLVFKKKRRKRYHRTHGHRTDVTILRIDEVSAGERTEEEELLSPPFRSDFTGRIHSPFYATEPGTEKPQEHYVYVDAPKMKQK
eukprot:gb/GEZN01012345.1/.p1 GENE.gb/GEZN01012345.1/~~gb/GEZN01012345.1/.p1  ORF type:complete len:298 (-),score=54.52 gb/GEZN01012345.1/:26-919(-)